MSAPRKFDQEIRDRAVRMYRDRLEQQDGESKLAARRQVGVLLDVNPATIRNWVEDAERREGVRVPAGPRAVESEEVRALRRENAELRRANDILKTASAFSHRRSSTADSSDRGLHRRA